MSGAALRHGSAILVALLLQTEQASASATRVNARESNQSNVLWSGFRVAEAPRRLLGWIAAAHGVIRSRDEALIYNLFNVSEFKRYCCLDRFVHGGCQFGIDFFVAFVFRHISFDSSHRLVTSAVIAKEDSTTRQFSST